MTRRTFIVPAGKTVVGTGGTGLPPLRFPRLWLAWQLIKWRFRP